ncbi:MAG: hypothetical protein HEQ23_07650 [Tepidisphaera sp.]
MGVIPDRIIEQIIFGEQHDDLWVSQALLIGLTGPQATAIKAAVADCRLKFDNAEAARQASKAATGALATSRAAMVSLLSEGVASIKAFAEITNNPNVYVIAQIPPPQPPTPAPPPSQPQDIVAYLGSTGSVTLRFRAISPGGSTVYLVKRKLPGQSGFALIGTTGSGRGDARGYKEFTDVTLPANANNIQYIIQGQRGEVLGEESPVFVVTLGSGGVTVTTLSMAA